MRRTILLLSIFASTALGQTTSYIISPFDSQNHYGTDDPFTIFNTQAPSVRYQQVYASSDFGAVPGPHLITEITFSSGAAALDINVPNVQINLSTTQKQPDGLSSAFSQNVGSDSQSVFSGALHLLSGGFSTYGVHIPLQQPFLYDPGLGNLLLEVRNFQTIAPTSLNHLLLADLTTGDSSSLAAAFNVNSDTAIMGTGALLTEFTMTQVPEPSSLALITAALLGLAVLAWRRKGGVTEDR